MSSHSDNQRSSSSPGDQRKESEHFRSRSRSREKHRRRQERDEYRSKGSRKQKVIRVPDTDELVSFRVFLANQPDKISREVAQKQYQIYKAQWEEKNNQSFYKKHNGDAWFQEKYNPEVLDAIERGRQEKVNELAKKFFDSFTNGYYKDVDLSVKDTNSLGFICNDREDDQDELKELVGSNNSTAVPISSQTADVNLSSTINISNAPFFGFDPDCNTIFIKAIPKTISRFDIYEFVGKLEGYETITLSEPVKKIHFARYAWITFKDDFCLRKAEENMNGLIIKDEALNFSRSITKQRRVKILKKYPIERIKTDAEVAMKLAAKLDEECGVTNNILLSAEFPDVKKKFDIFLLYLRKVHAFDYFTSTAFPNQRTLCLKLGLSFLRIQVDYEEIPDFPTVFKKMQSLAENIIEKGSQIPDHMGRLREDIEKSLIKTACNQEGITLEKIMEKTAWECVYCNKKFKTSEFLSKHIISKHQERKDKHIQFLMEQAYYSDPNKVTSYSGSRDERDYNKSRKPGFKRERRREYRDLDEPEGPVVERTVVKPAVNFLDI